jgi:hypothetical protein
MALGYRGYLNLRDEQDEPLTFARCGDVANRTAGVPPEPITPRFQVGLLHLGRGTARLCG